MHTHTIKRAFRANVGGGAVLSGLSEDTMGSHHNFMERNISLVMVLM